MCIRDRGYAAFAHMKGGAEFVKTVVARERAEHQRLIGWRLCLLYTSDAADERSSVDLGGRRIIKKKKKKH